MAVRATTKAGRKKVRCPKCTALFPEPAKAVFECPICACRLSANEMNGLMETPSHQARDADSGYTKAFLGTDEPNKVQRSMDFVKKEGNGTTIEVKSTDSEQDSVAWQAQVHKKREQQPIMDSSQVFNNGNADGQPSVGGSSIEGGRDGMLGPSSPKHSMKNPGNLLNENGRRESLPPFSVGADESTALVSTRQQQSSDDGPKDNFTTVTEESSPNATGEEGIERKDCAINTVSGNRHLQSRLLQTTRCEFSFKYAIKGASPFQSAGDLLHLNRSNAKSVSSNATLSNTGTSDMPLQSPLRIRISKSHEESSDQSEHGRESFGSETDSDDTSGSDFGFPAPWAEGPQDIVPPAPFSQNEAFQPNSGTLVLAAPHQLELQDVDETINQEELTMQEDSREYSKVHKAEFSSQVESSGKTIQSEEFHHELLQADEKNHVSLEPSERAEIARSESKPILSHDQSLDVSDLASRVSSSTHLSLVGDDKVLLMKDSAQKLNGSGSQECSEGRKELEAVLKENSQQENSRNEESFPNGVQQEACGVSDVIVAFNSGQVSAMNNYGNGTQESPNASSIRDALLMNPASLPDQEYLGPKQSAPNLDHMNHRDETCVISNTGGFQMVKMNNHQMTEALSSNVHKIEHSNDEADAGGGGTANHHVSSHMVNTELEQDLYKLPHDIYGNGLLMGGNSHSALWLDEETGVPALSDSLVGSTSKSKLHYEKKNTQKSSHGKLRQNLGSRLIRGDNGEDHFFPGEARNLRRAPGASREGSLQAITEHVDWEGHINAVESGSGHPDLREMEGKPGSYSQYPTNNSPGFPLANPQPYAFANQHHNFAASTNQIYSYQLPSQSLMHPAAYQNHALSHCGCHAMSPACMLRSYHQHPHMQPQQIPHCGACFSQSSSIGYNSGLVEHWNCHQANLGSASSCAGSLIDYPQAYSSTSRARRYDSPNAESRFQVSSVKKYPPIPKNGAAPYITCKGCTRVLQVPSDLPLYKGMMHKLRCSACGKVSKFSANCYGQRSGIVSPPELDAMGGITNSWPSLVQYGNNIRQQPISPASESIKSPYRYDTVKINPILQGPSTLSPHTAALRTSEQNSKHREFVQAQPAMDASCNTYGQRDPSVSTSTAGPAHLPNAAPSMVGLTSPRSAVLRSTDGFGVERSKTSPAASFLTVDEKEEGLDFGAPRISDGDSLDHSDSRMRSPENNQACHETMHADVSQGTPSIGDQSFEQVSDLSEEYGMAAQQKPPGSPLLILLNQESTRFRLNIEPNVSFVEGSESTMWSPVSDSPLYASSLRNHARKSEQDNPQSHSSPRQHFVSKGPKYIAGLLRRSLRDFSKGGQ